LGDPDISRKLSDALASRLGKAPPDSRVRVVLLVGHSSKRRKRDGDRSGQIPRVRESANAALGEVDGILTAHEGRRIESEPSALGHVTVETTPAGIRALAQSHQLRAILEDQVIRSVQYCPGRQTCAALKKPFTIPANLFLHPLHQVAAPAMQQPATPAYHPHRQPPGAKPPRSPRRHAPAYR
jgi:hypothetical protein